MAGQILILTLWDTPSVSCKADHALAYRGIDLSADLAYPRHKKTGAKSKKTAERYSRFVFAPTLSQKGVAGIQVFVFLLLAIRGSFAFSVVEQAN